MKKLKQIAPVWAQRIKDGTVNEYEEDLWVYSKCIVGEAWRHSDQYKETCKECEECAVKFVGESCYLPVLPQLKKTIKRFEDHFNKEHLP